jgi:hypothetical protein
VPLFHLLGLNQEHLVIAAKTIEPSASYSRISSFGNLPLPVSAFRRGEIGIVAELHAIDNGSAYDLGIWKVSVSLPTEDPMSPTGGLKVVVIFLILLTRLVPPVQSTCSMGVSS